MNRHISVTLSLLCLISFPFFSAHASFDPVRAAWTVMFYVAGDEKIIEKPIDAMLAKIKKVKALEKNSRVNILVQRDATGEDPNYRYAVTASNPELGKTALGEQDSGNPLTLKSFLVWAITNYPADHYILVVSGHSWGQQGVLQDFHVTGLPTSDTELDFSTMIKFYELRRIMEEIHRDYGKFIPHGRFDALVVDACIALQLEVALELKDVFDYLVMSSNETPYSGLPFDETLDSFIGKVNQSTVAQLRSEESSRSLIENDFLAELVKLYARRYAPNGPLALEEKEVDVVQLAALRTSRLQGVQNALTDLVSSLASPNLILPKTNISFARLWKDEKLKFLSNLADMDNNIDLLQMSTVLEKKFEFFRKLSEKKNPGRAAEWKLARNRARNLFESLGYHPREDKGLEKTVIANPKAKGAWVQITADPLVVNPQVALCNALKSYSTLNSDQASVIPMLWQMKSPADEDDDDEAEENESPKPEAEKTEVAEEKPAPGEEPLIKVRVNAAELECHELAQAYAEKHPEEKQPDFSKPTKVDRLFDLIVEMPRRANQARVPIYFEEVAVPGNERLVAIKKKARIDYVPRPAVRRNVWIWLTESREGVGIDRSVILPVAGSWFFGVHLVKSGSPENFMKWPYSKRDKATVKTKVSPFVVVSHPEHLKIENVPGPGLYVAEGHSNGTLFKHGLGIWLVHDVDGDDPETPYQRGRVPIERVTGTPYSTLEQYFAALKAANPEKDLNKALRYDLSVKGRDFYKLHRITETGWPRFLFSEGI